MDGTEELAEIIVRHAESGAVTETAIPRLHLIRSDRPTEPLHVLHQPAICFVAQGRKEVMLGREVFRYGREQHLVISLDLPVVGEITQASPEAPYLCLRLDLDPLALAPLFLEAGLERGRDEIRSGLALGRTGPDLLEAVTRLARLLDRPREASILAPSLEREVLLRLLLADEGASLRGIAFVDGGLRRVGRAIAWIKRHYRRPFSGAAVAAAAGMSPSSLHAHFKAVTRLTPLQYQKRLRLQEARRLILGGAANAANAGQSVGYDSPSQFSRDYRRLFGDPPRRDVTALRARLASPEPALAEV